MFSKLKRIAKYIVVLFLILIASGASFNGYFTKWTFRDCKRQFGIEKILDGTADRPFVYRQLLPQVAKFIDKHTPEAIKRQVNANTYISDTFKQATIAKDIHYAFTYKIIFVIVFICIFMCALLLSSVLYDFTNNIVASIAASCISILLIPVIMTVGGYFYDPPEWLFFTVGFKIAKKYNIWFLLPLSLIATLNKESFLFFIPTLLPLLLSRYSKMNTILPFVSAIGLSIIMNLIIKHSFSMNPGFIMENHFWHNLLFYCNPNNYLQWEFTYSILMPKGFNIVNVVIIVMIIGSTWQSIIKPIRQSFIIALTISVPLLIGCCWEAELRNMSLLFVPLSIMIAQYISQIINHERHNYKV